MIGEISSPRALKPTGERPDSVLEWPAYRVLLDNDELERRVVAYAYLAHCDLCARYCRVNRRQTLDDVIRRTGERAVVHVVEVRRFATALAGRIRTAPLDRSRRWPRQAHP